ncbi:MAG: MmgE/PrpD family protein [Burkholderiales bacterium]|jgi:2-methylcitrate dehydratase PrpD
MTETVPAVTEALRRFIATSAEAPWPEDTLELGRRHILDTIASIVVCGDRTSAQAARQFALRHSGSGAGGAPILGTAQRASLPDAIFASAMTAHGAEINDFCPSAFVQPGPAVVSAALCVAETDGLPGSRVLRAVITGYELCCRLPKALGIRRSRRLGYSTHGYAPVFGTAATIASLRRYPEDQVSDMLSYCAQQVSGSMQWLLDVGHVEKSFVFAGMPARNGAHAALLTECGFTGVPNSLDVKGGWFTSGMFRAEDSDYNPQYLIEQLGERFEMPLVAYKRYPVGGPAQPVVQAMLDLATRVDRHHIEAISIEMPGAVDAFANAEMPALNLPYLCSVILIDGGLSFEMADSIERKNQDAEIQELMQRVRVIHDPEQEAEPRKESARVTVRLKNGVEDTVFVEHVRGYPPNPMSHQDVEDKALDLMVPVLGEGRTRSLIDSVWHIDRLQNAGLLVEAMRSDLSD